MEKGTGRRMDKGFVIGIVVVILGMSMVPSTALSVEDQSLPVTGGGWLYVGGSGPGNYTRIQDAIDNATPGDTVFVFNGIYYENLLINTNSITLIGEYENSTIIDGARKDIVLITRANDTAIQGFTIQNASTGMFNDIGVVAASLTGQLHQIQISHCVFKKDGRGIYFSNVSDSSITDCRIQDLTAQSVSLYRIANNITMANCLIKHCGTDMGGAAYSGGIFYSGLNSFTANDITIINNTFLQIAATAIQFDCATDVDISQNTIHDCTWWGITIGLSTQVSIVNNDIYRCKKNGIMTSVSDIQIIGNRVSDCGKGEVFDGGILIQDSKRNATIANNSISGSEPYGIFLIRSPGSRIDSNNIMNNTYNAFVLDTLYSHWHGNYWDDYRGIGPKLIYGLHSNPRIHWAHFDRHPAKEPYETPIAT